MARLLKRRVRGSKFLVLLGISLSKCLVCDLYKLAMLIILY